MVYNLSLALAASRTGAVMDIWPRNPLDIDPAWGMYAEAAWDHLIATLPEGRTTFYLEIELDDDKEIEDWSVEMVTRVLSLRLPNRVL